MDTDRLITILRGLDMASDLVDPVIARIQQEGLTDEIKDEVLLLLRQAATAAHIEGAALHEALDTVETAQQQIDELELKADRDFQTIYKDTREQLDLSTADAKVAPPAATALNGLLDKENDWDEEWPDDLATTPVPVPAAPIITQAPTSVPARFDAGAVAPVAPVRPAVTQDASIMAPVVAPVVPVEPVPPLVAQPVVTPDPTAVVIPPVMAEVPANPVPVVPVAEMAASASVVPTVPAPEVSPVAPVTVPVTADASVVTPQPVGIPDSNAPDTIDWLSLLSDEGTSAPAAATSSVVPAAPVVVPDAAPAPTPMTVVPVAPAAQ